MLDNSLGEVLWTGFEVCVPVECLSRQLGVRSTLAFNRKDARCSDSVPQLLTRLTRRDVEELFSGELRDVDAEVDAI